MDEAAIKPALNRISHEIIERNKPTIYKALPISEAEEAHAILCAVKTLAK